MDSEVAWGLALGGGGEGGRPPTKFSKMEALTGPQLSVGAALAGKGGVTFFRRLQF